MGIAEHCAQNYPIVLFHNSTFCSANQPLLYPRPHWSIKVEVLWLHNTAESGSNGAMICFLMHTPV